MASLNPQVKLLPSGSFEMTWTPDPAVFGYRFYRNGVAVSKGTNPSQKVTQFGHMTTEEQAMVAAGGQMVFGIAKAFEQAAETALYPPTPSGGTTYEAYPGQAASVISQAKDGDRVILVGGIHSALTLNKDFSTSKRLTIGCDASSLIRGLNVGGRKGYRFAPVGDPYAFHAQIPVELYDYNKTPFYASGDCDVIVGGTMEGGYEGVKVYGSGSQLMGRIVLDGVICQGNGGDCCHVNGANYFEAKNYIGRDLIDAGPEHHDGLQVERAGYVKVGPNVEITWPVLPRRDEPNNGMLLQGELSTGPGIVELVLDGVKIHKWYGGRGFQLTSAKKASLRNLQVIDCGDGKPYPGPGSPPITLGGVKGAGMVYDLYGVDKSQVYMNNSYATVNYHAA